MTPIELLAQLKNRNVSLSVSDRGELRVQGQGRALEAAWIERIREHKPALIALLAGEAGRHDVPPNAIPDDCSAITPQMLPLVSLSQDDIDRIVRATPGGAANVQDIYPLAPLQEGILFHHLLAPHADPYRLQMVFGFDRRETLDRYLAGLHALVRRHDILRTAVLWEGLPQPLQVVRRSAVLPVQELPPAADGEDLVARLQALAGGCALDVREAPLMRVFIAHEPARGRWVMLQLFHHLVMDHMTLEVAHGEILAHMRGGEAALPTPAPYRDFVVHSRGSVADAQHEAFFREMLDGVDETTAPLGLGDVHADGSGTAEASLALEPALARRLRTGARAAGVGTASLCHLAWAMVMARLGGRDDVVFGTLMLGRMQADAHARGLGLFINTLPLRVRIDARSVQDALRDTHVLLGRLLRHEHASLALAQRCSGVAAPAPLFTALLNYRYGVDEGHPGAATDGVRLLGARERTNYPLSLSVDDLGEGFGLHVLAHDSVDPMRICAFMRQALQTLVDALESSPRAPLCGLDVMPAEERRQVLHDWNATAVARPEDVALHELIEAQAARAPDTIAVSDEAGSLTHAELDRRANRLARYLRSLGVGPDVRVALCLERSVSMVVGLLATLKAGGAYVPLDPGYPAERLAYMAADCGAAVLLTEGGAADALRDGLGALPVVDLQADAMRWAGQPGTPLARMPGFGDRCLAYVIYTSGSTGRPKGAMNEHRGVVNRLLWMQDTYGLHAGDAVLQKTPFSFDVSVWEFFWPLLAGARLVMARPGGHKDPAYLAQVIARERITTLHFVPSMLQLFVDSGEAARCTGLRLVFCSGEALPGALARRTREQLPQAGLHNLYGPTEAAVDVTAWPCQATQLPDNIPIGRPVANTSILLLDGAGRPVPVGVPGELHIGGVQVGRGYLNRPELTAERFVPDPFSGAPDARLYKTGDLARWLPGGDIEYLGRNDHQVKLRGFRIELPEIEARLLEHPAVQDAVVTAQAQDADARLVAYVVPSASSAAPVRRLLQLQAAGETGEAASIELPNGLTVFHQNRGETEFLYEEIFGDRIYLKHGIRLDGASCVVDVGANIGLFTLFAAQQCPQATIHAFEPIPPVLRSLRLNAQVHATNARVHACALGAAPGRETFNFYPHNTVVSGRTDAAGQARETVAAFVRRQLAQGEGKDEGETLVDELVDDRLASEAVECEVRTLSQVIAEQGITRIDLLKVDVESAEESVLQGIDAADWPRIGQVVLEVHDVAGRLARIVDLLRGHGFEVHASQDPTLRDTRLHDVYARRTGWVFDPAAASPPAGGWASPAALQSALRSHLQQRLPEFMVPSAVVLLDRMPLTPNGKLDRQALPSPDARAGTVRDDAPPQGETEVALARLWTELLKVEGVGRHDNFFERGGHSLLAVRLVLRVQQAMGVQISLAQLFEQPQLHMLARCVEAASRAGVEAPIETVDRGAPMPLSFAQQRLWVLSQIDGVSRAYHVPVALELRGALDHQALIRALDRLVARHESLRTSFPKQDGVPVQRIAPAEAGFALGEHDLSGEPDREEQLQALMAEEAQARFDLAQGPLARGRLVTMEVQRHVLMLTFHHIVTDGWSMGVFARELAALYGAFVQARPDPLSPLTLQYADYAAWQRRRLQGEGLQKQADHWRRTLADAPVLLALPTDRPRPPQQDMAGASVPLVFDAALAGGLKALARRQGTTLFMTLLAGWAVLLSRLSGDRDLVVGVPVANRPRAEVEPLVGLFINTLALRLDLSSQPTVAQWLQQVKAGTVQAQGHQDLPFEQVVEIARPPRSLAHTPLFQVAFDWQEAAQEGLALAGLAVRRIESPLHSARLDLTLHLAEDGERIVGGLEYATALFDRVTIERHGAMLKQVLGQMVADEQQRVDRLDVLPMAERETVLRVWNETKQPVPVQRCVQELFEAQVSLQPNASALEQGDRRLSYAQLEAQANQLAHELKALGVGPEQRVALCAERSVEMVVAMLAVLKAGGAYVPLDPAQPGERLAQMVRDCAPSVLLVFGALGAVAQARLREAHAGPLLHLHADAARWSGRPAERSGASAIPANLAYVIYTSGSTGVPKGVMVEHRQLNHLVHWHARAFELKAGERSSSVAGVGFDATTWEVWPPLCTGGTLVLPPAHEAQDPGALLGWWKRQALQVSFLPTPMAELALAEPGAPAGLRVLLTGGDRLRQRGGEHPFRLVNNYGPTENTVVATSGELKAGEPVLHIGRPIDNARIYLLDPLGQPVPIGVTGEIHIGGAGVARGYLNRPEQTAERFVADPFSDEPQARMYRSGDLARWRADGTIEFIGRNDHQVKIRGLRIELGEVEAQLLRQPGVREAVVLARDGQLVAYVVAEGEAEGLRERLGERLGERLAQVLPQYMVPSAWVSLPALPLTPNGKLDRQALPAPEAQAQRAYEAPQGEVEAELARIWAEVLKLERVGRHDNFFELGGHSIAAVRLLAGVQQSFGVQLGLGTLFERPVLEALAGQLAAARPADCIVPVPRDGVLPLSHPQRRLWILSQMQGLGHAYHVPLALEIDGPLNRTALVRALDRIVERHEALRTRFPVRDGEPVQRFAAPDAGFALQVQALDTDRDLPAIMHAEAHATFNLATGPLVRGRLLVLGSERHVLLVTLHHIVTDGWSMGVFARELATLYGAFCAGQADPLPPLRIQYADHAAWQHRSLDAEVLRAQAAYWQRTLRGAPALLALPTDRPRPPVQDPTGAAEDLVLDGDLTERLKALSRRHGTTLFVTLLAGWAALLSRLSGEHDVVIGTPVANRQRAEAEPLIGLFVNTLALRLDLSSRPTVAQLLQQAKAATLQAQRHQDLPFEQVVEQVQPPRSTAHTPLFQAMLSWHDAGASAPALPGLTVRRAAAPYEVARFDLTLQLAEEDERIVGRLEYASALFDRDTIRRHLDSLCELLRGMCGVPGQTEHEADGRPFDTLPLLAPAERHKLLVDWNATASAYPRRPVHEIFEAQAMRTPGAEAVVDGARRATYAELDAHADALAAQLAAAGVRPGEHVAIALARSLELVVSQLAVLKCGAAYVPLDVQAPPARQTEVLADSGARVVLGGQAVPAGVLRIDVDLRAGGAREAAPAPRVQRGADAVHEVAYVMYTSGSTGGPKGVRVPHRAIVRLVIDNRYAGFGPGDRVAFAANPAFDASTLEVWAPLLNGGCVVVVDQDTLLAPQRFAQTLLAERVDVLWLTVGLFNHCADALAEAFTRLRVLIVGGDALDPVVIDRVLRRSPPRHLLNGYGPTETTTFAATFEITAVAPGQRSIPIGRPIGSTRLYILDAHRQPVPVGTAGELYIGGHGVALGYLNQPELTAERFLADPFDDEPGARMYRTGDMARWLPGGEVEFLGRADGQVKLRGFRVELGEIEARLMEHPGVREAVVLLREDDPGDKRLVAYVAGDDTEPAALRAHLAERLPGYMLPAACVRLPALPLNANGKVDRKALPPPGTADCTWREYEAPRDDTEQRLARVWAEMLKLERVGRHDHFFELGGHSLLAISMVERLRGEGLHLDARALFSTPTLALVAANAKKIKEVVL